MKKAMKSTMVVAVLATIIFTILYRTTENSVMLSLAITAGTISYHFVIRYVVAGIFNSVMQKICQKHGISREHGKKNCTRSCM